MAGNPGQVDPLVSLALPRPLPSRPLPPSAVPTASLRTLLWAHSRSFTSIRVRIEMNQNEERLREISLRKRRKASPVAPCSYRAFLTVFGI